MIIYDNIYGKHGFVWFLWTKVLLGTSFAHQASASSRWWLHSVPSSSGLGRLVLIQKIAGSTPAGITRLLQLKIIPRWGIIFNWRELTLTPGVHILCVLGQEKQAFPAPRPGGRLPLRTQRREEITYSRNGRGSHHIYPHYVEGRGRSIGNIDSTHLYRYYPWRTNSDHSFRDN